MQAAIKQLTYRDSSEVLGRIDVLLVQDKHSTAGFRGWQQPEPLYLFTHP